jgi:outer membrane protein
MKTGIKKKRRKVVIERCFCLICERRFLTMRLFCCIVLMFSIMPLKAGAEELIRKGETLDIKRCIEIAIERQPNILAAIYNIKAGESRIGQARANYFPQVNWNSAYSRNNQPVTTLNTSLVPLLPYNDYSSFLSLTQNIYDFGRTSNQVQIQSLSRDASQQDLQNVTSLIVFTVKQFYYGLLQAQKNRDVALGTVQQFQQHLDQANGFFTVGVKAKFDVTKAEVDLSNAELNLMTAENNVLIAAVNLNNAMGYPKAPNYNIQDNLAYQPYEISFEEAVKRAYAERPDLQSVLLKEGALQKTLDLAKKGYYPYITGTANYGFDNQEFPLSKGWVVGAQLTVPLFSGNSTKYQMDEARANLDALKANEESLRQSIYLDVQQAFLNLQLAKNQIVTAELAVRQADDNLDIANGRYAAGLGNPIEVTDSLVAQSNAKTAYIAALYNYKIAQASAERAMGVR